MRWTALLLAGTLMSPVMAAAAPKAFELQKRTQRVSYYSRGKARVDVERSEEFLARLFEVFGEAPEGWRLEYYLHGSGSVRSASGAHATGITDLVASRIDSIRPFHPHELVHAVAGRVGRCPVFFAEGIAVALTSEGRWGERSIDEVARTALASGTRLEPFLRAFEGQDPRLAYPLSGSFVGFLIDRHGIEAFVTFLRECGPSPRGHEGAFRRAFGQSVARATIAWQMALGRGEAVRWTWNDPATWPSSLHRSPSPVPSPAGPVALRERSAAGESALLLSIDD